MSASSDRWKPSSLGGGGRLCFAPLEIIMHALWALQRNDKIKRGSAELNITRDKNTDAGDIAGVFLQHSLQIRVLECLGMGAKEKKRKERKGGAVCCLYQWCHLYVWIMLSRNFWYNFTYFQGACRRKIVWKGQNPVSFPTGSSYKKTFK